MTKKIVGDFELTDLYDLKTDEYEKIENEYYYEGEREYTLEEYYEQIVGDLQPGEKFVATWYTGNSEEVTIPEGVFGIGEKLFFKNETLKKINMPSSVQKIYDWAFFVCPALEEVNLSENIDEIGMYAFCECTRLKKMSFPGSVRTLGDNILRNCNSLEEVIFNEGMKVIPKALFGRKNELIKKVVIPDSVETIDWNAFEGCSALEEVTFGKNVKVIEVSAFSECKSLKSVSLPESLEEIGLTAFSECDLTEVYIPKNVKELGWLVFDKNPNFKELVISPDNPYFYVRNNCIFNKSDNVLIGAASNYKIPDDGSVKIIGRAAFHRDTSIVDLRLPEGLEIIAARAFDECKNMRSATLPNTLKTICSTAFGDCPGLTEITIPGSVEIVENGAFFRAGLRKVVFKRGVLTVEDDAFRSCRFLKEVYIPSSVSFPDDDNPFYECNKSLKIYIEESDKEKQNKLLKSLKKFNVKFIKRSKIFD